jgi:hypothetical protein
VNVQAENVYRRVLTAQRLSQGVGVVALTQLALAFSQMAKDLRLQNASVEQQNAFQSAIAHAAVNARHLTSAERMAVQNTLSTAFDGLPRDSSAMAVRTDFLRQVRFPAVAGAFGSTYAAGTGIPRIALREERERARHVVGHK